MSRLEHSPQQIGIYQGNSACILLVEEAMVNKQVLAVVSFPTELWQIVCMYAMLEIK